MSYRIDFIKQEDNGLSRRKQCALLSVNRTLLYPQERQVHKEEVDIMNEIREIWLKWPFYGRRRIREVLKDQGFTVNHKRISRLMKVMGIEALYPRPNVSRRTKEHKVYPYLLKDLVIERPDHVWATDITYIKMGHGIGFVYLIGLIDIYSRYIVSWSLSTTLETQHCVRVLEEGLKHKRPAIVNSDQGSQFTDTSWIGLCQEYGILISMDGKGRCLDNIYIERFWRSVKYEEIYLTSYETIKEARQEIGNYIEFYNNERPHQSLNYKKPVAVYLGCS